MRIVVQDKSGDLKPHVREEIEASIEGVAEKYFSGGIDADAVFTRAGRSYACETAVHIGRNLSVRGSGTAQSIRLAFDDAIEHLEKRLRRHKRRLRNHRALKSDSLKSQEAINAQAYSISLDSQDDGDESPDAEDVTIVAETDVTIHELSTSQAAMYLDLTGAPAMLFRRHGEINMVFRRADGNIGWIDPSLSKDTLKKVPKDAA
ncbi:MAG: ribosome-associated translation inhibitor RaiA [Pseudomonadota bacterium]